MDANASVKLWTTNTGPISCNNRLKTIAWSLCLPPMQASSVATTVGSGSEMRGGKGAGAALLHATSVSLGRRNSEGQSSSPLPGQGSLQVGHFRHGVGAQWPRARMNRRYTSFLGTGNTPCLGGQFDAAELVIIRVREVRGTSSQFGRLSGQPSHGRPVLATGADL